jgi:hypothetical protein
MYYLANAFSLNMLPGAARMSVDPLTEESAISYLKSYIEEGLCKSVVGHQGTTDVLSAKFGMDIPMNRTNLKLSYGDSVYVAQVGTRLQEGQVLSQAELEAVPLSFWVVTVMRQG